MKLFSNKLSAVLFCGVVLVGLSTYAYLGLIGPYERHSFRQRAIDTCKDFHIAKLHEFKPTFKDVTVHVLESSDFGEVVEVTGTVTHVEKDGSLKSEAMGCKMSY
jgi:hypothetical protein